MQSIVNNLISQRLSCCILTNLCNVLYTVSTQKYIITVIQYIQLSHITATCFGRTGHLQANEEHYYCTVLYLNNVLHWPEDDRLRSKHVAVM